MAEKIREKVQKFKAPEFRKFDGNWLCIYNFQGDEWGVEVGRAADILLGALGPDRELRTTFTAIYILSSDRYFFITSDFVHGRMISLTKK